MVEASWEIGVELWPSLEDVRSHRPGVDITDSGFEGLGDLVFARFEIAGVAVAELKLPVDLQRVAEQVPKDVAAVSVLMKDEALPEAGPNHSQIKFITNIRRQKTNQAK